MNYKNRDRKPTRTQYAKQEGATEIKHLGINAGLPQHCATATGANAIDKETFSTRNAQNSTRRRHWRVDGIQKTHAKPNYRQLYHISYAGEIGRLKKGMPGVVEGSNTMFL